MIKKAIIRKFNGKIYIDELYKVLAATKDGEYQVAVYDNNKVSKLPFNTYLFKVVLTYLSQSLPDHPSTIALYKYFEDMFAPIHTCTINGEQFSYCELKSEKKIDVNDVIEKIVEYALNEWGIKVPRDETMAKPEVRELYSQAYVGQDVDWSSVISSLNISKDNERRIKKTKRF